MSIRTYWFRKPEYSNLGDELTKIILPRLHNETATYCSYRNAELISTGSVLGWIRPQAPREDSTPQHVVGSGFMHAHDQLCTRDGLDFHSVRGYLTKQKLTWLALDSVSVGDPGLLVPLVADIKSNFATSRVGLIPHFSQMENLELFSEYEHLAPKILDIRTKDLDGFISEMSSCDYIVSQSLHGLIFADALGIPNAWARIASGESGKDFKFFDYFSSVGRDFSQGMSKAPESLHALRRHLYRSDPNRIRNLQVDIKVSYAKAIEGIVGA